MVDPVLVINKSVYIFGGPDAGCFHLEQRSEAEVKIEELRFYDEYGVCAWLNKAIYLVGGGKENPDRK
jgi:hypothetical protein